MKSWRQEAESLREVVATVSKEKDDAVKKAGEFE